MGRLFKICAAFVVASSFSCFAAEPNTPAWKAVGDWMIRIDPSLNNGCFMFGSYVGGEMLRFGLDRQHANGYLDIGSQKWSSLVAGKSYAVSFRFDSYPAWTGNAVAISMGPGLVVLTVSFSSPEVMKELADAKSMVMYYNGNLVANLPLTGTKAAVAELVNCQNEVDARSGTSSPSSNDPFSQHTQSASDPFAH